MGTSETLNLWDLATKRVVTSFPGFRPADLGSALSPDGKTLAIGQGNTIQLWNLAVGQQVAVLKGHAGVVYTIAFSPDGNLLASAASDGTVRLWRAPSFAEIDRAGGSAATMISRMQQKAEGRPQ